MRRTCKLELKPPFSRSSVLAPSVSIRYRPTAASPLTSPARTCCTYDRTRSSISATDFREDSRTSRSVTGCEVVEFGAADVVERRSTTTHARSDQLPVSEALGIGRTAAALCVVESELAWDRCEDAVFGLRVHTNGGPAIRCGKSRKPDSPIVAGGARTQCMLLRPLARPLLRPCSQPDVQLGGGLPLASRSCG